MRQHLDDKELIFYKAEGFYKNINKIYSEQFTNEICETG